MIRCCFFIFGLFISFPSWSLDIYGVYLGDCKRELGTIVDVRDQSFDLLNLDGKIITLPRYKAIYLVTYPLDVLPIKSFTATDDTKVYKVGSLDNKEIKPLLDGWAINFTKDQISFLTLSGKEVLVDKTDIWKIRKPLIERREGLFQNKSRSLKFVDPYPFSHCKRDKARLRVIPQKLYSDAVDVKREFDRLQAGHKQIAKFMRRQVFYPKPQIYENSAILGMWLMAGARYGASESRPNNFSPFLTNEMSLGAYAYQHVIRTGSGPLLDGSHDEIQTHFYYRMKAEYIHLSIMVDPNTLLVGSQYEWSREDIDKVDFRSNESTMLELGFDYGRWSIEFSPLMDLQTGALFDGNFVSSSIPLIRAGLRYSGVDFSVNFMAGSGDETDFENGASFNQDMTFFRANYQRKFGRKHKAYASVIYKNVEGNVTSASFDFTSLSVSGIYEYRYKKRYFFGGLLGIESTQMEVTGSSVNSEQSDTHLKIGINSGLRF